jgi:hypothetical protein
MYYETFDIYLYVYLHILCLMDHIFTMYVHVCVCVLLFMCVQYANLILDYLEYLSFDLVS